MNWTFGIFGFLGAVAMSIVLVFAAYAVEPEERLADPALEQRAREIAKGLRCVVCQNQSIDDSDATIAADMRKLVRERLVAGDSDADIQALMVGYYGEYVLLRPRFSWSNAFLWGAPAAALMIGGFLLWRKIKASGTQKAAAVPGQAAELTDEEQKRLDEILNSKPPS
jgi:cytochrome c-type biogenesis protein CcmH